ncbi:CsbD family protein [Streptomyces sp. IBSBF 2435]|uniref:CsbD family protein n=1 Tax=Streptomyces sp. IBSBF 2435 TaxID=2903531 RepID=UPI002FDC76D9
MGDNSKTHAKVDEAKGKVKETIGHAVGNERLEAEGRAEQAQADARQAGEKAKDAAKDIFHTHD